MNRKIQFAFSAALLILLAICGVSYIEMAATTKSDIWVWHTHQVLECLQDMRFAMANAESSARGFVLTDKSSYLDTYHASLTQLAKDQADFRNLTIDNPVQQQQIPLLEALTEQKVHRMELVMGVRRGQSYQAAAHTIQTGPGQMMMTAFLATVDRMQTEEMRLLVLRNADARRHLLETRAAIILGTLVGLLIAAGAGWSAQRDSSRRGLAAGERRTRGVRRESDARYRGLLEAAPDAMVIVNQKGEIVLLNVQTEKQFGYHRDELVGQEVTNIIPEGFAERLIADALRSTEDALAQQIGTGIELTGLRKNGSGFPIEIMLSPLKIGEEILVTVAIRDITVRKISEESLFSEKERAQATLHCIGDAVASMDVDGNITFLNPVAEKMTGWSEQEALGHPMTDVFCIVDAATRKAIANPMERALDQNRTKHLPMNCLLIRRDETEIFIEDSAAPIRDRQAQAIGAVIVFRDVSESRAMALQIAHSAEHDFLTGLPNRLLLHDRLSQAIALAERHKHQVAVLFLDMDGFKHINDSLGHAIGDRLLQSIAARLVDCVRAPDTVSRQGGDEFIVLLSEVDEAEDAVIAVRRILQAVAGSHSIDEHDLHITASIGVSVYPGDGQDAATLIKNADTAMYQAKENGRQTYQFFRPEMNIRAVERQFIESGLRRALERQEFKLYYQPMIHLATGAITGAEALLRWEHPTRGMVSPADFIPVAESCGLILPIGTWVLREACAQARLWLDAGLPELTMAVNVSAMQFRNENFVDDLFTILQQTGLDPKHLELEVTEGVLMKRVDFTATVLQTLRERGIRVAVDDFGTGYSSLSYLRRFPLDVLKIDQSFVRQITTTPEETTIVSTIISMARSLNLRVVAEGVETPEELAFLRSHLCDDAQGYFFSRPVPPADFVKLLQAAAA